MAMQKINIKNNESLKYIIISSFKLAIIYNLLFNIFNFYKYATFYQSSSIIGYFEISYHIILNIIVTLCIFAIGQIHRLIQLLIYLLLFTSAAFAFYYSYYYKVPISKEIINAFFATNETEFIEQISIKVITGILVAALLSIYLAYRVKIIQNKNFTVKLFLSFAVIFSLLNCKLPINKNLKNFFPINYLRSSYLLIEDKIFQPSKLLDIAHNKFIDNSEDDLKIVLMIGESARADHFSINGYERHTSPLIEKIDNFISFKDAKSCTAMTYTSVPCMLTRATLADPDYAFKEATINTVFQKLGYFTAWLGTQKLSSYYRFTAHDGFYDSYDIQLLPGGSFMLKMNDYDAKLLPFFKKVLSKKDKSFIILHSSGSHWNYEQRYPKEFAKFNPLCNSDTSFDALDCAANNSLINIYDNSIYYTDYVINEVISQLKDKNALFIYASDHGDSLGENDRYGHGNMQIDEQRQIPFFVWMSDKFINNNPNKLAALKQNKAKAISHDFIFHSLLDCASIEGEIIDKDLSLCNYKNND